MSPLVLLGSLGTLTSSISILPHLIHALRNRRPVGSPFAWAFGAFSSAVWFVYGFAIGDIWVAAPGLITIPIGLGLAGWCLTYRRRTNAFVDGVSPVEVASAVETMPVYVPEWTNHGYASAGDTLELPRIVA